MKKNSVMDMIIESLGKHFDKFLEDKRKMYKFLGNFNMDFDINLNELKFNSHKIYSHTDNDSTIT